MSQKVDLAAVRLLEDVFGREADLLEPASGKVDASHPRVDGDVSGDVDELQRDAHVATRQRQSLPPIGAVLLGGVVEDEIQTEFGHGAGDAERVQLEVVFAEDGPSRLGLSGSGVGVEQQVHLEPFEELVERGRGQMRRRQRMERRARLRREAGVDELGQPCRPHGRVLVGVGRVEEGAEIGDASVGLVDRRRVVDEVVGDAAERVAGTRGDRVSTQRFSRETRAGEKGCSQEDQIDAQPSLEGGAGQMETSALLLQPLGRLHDTGDPRTGVSRSGQHEGLHQQGRRRHVRDGGERGRKGLEHGHGVVESGESQHDDGVGHEEEERLPGRQRPGQQARSEGRSTGSSYSTSRPGQRCRPSLVPDSMAQVPRFKARVSTTHR